MTKPVQVLDWSSLRTVLIASRCPSVTAAAQLLKVNESTVSRHIVYVEERLRTVLFHRTPSGIALTDAGRVLVRRLDDAEQQISRGIEDATGATAKAEGKVRVTAVPLLIDHLLIPRLATLTRDHPLLALELIGTSSDLSLNKRETDVALRLARPSSEMNVIASRVGVLRYAVYAAKRHGGRTLKSLPWIGYVAGMGHLPHAAWLSRYAALEPEAGPSVIVNDAVSALSCLRSGLGRSLLPRFVGDADPDLKRIDRYGDLPQREVWLMYHPDVKCFRRIEVVLDWVRQIATVLA